MASLLHDNQDFLRQMGGTLKQVALPAMAAGVGTGALSGYLSSREHRPDESPGQRRARIIRNAIFGLAAGGAAGAAVPLGVKAMTTPLGNAHPPLMERGIDSASNATMRHALPAGIGLVGGLGIAKGHYSNQNSALTRLFKNVGPAGADPAGTKVPNADTLRGMTSTPEGAGNVLERYVAAMGQTKAPRENQHLFAGRELMHEAGGRFPSMAELVKRYSPNPQAGAFAPGTALASADPEALNNAFKAHLNSQGLLGQAMSHFTGEGATPLLGNDVRNTAFVKALSRLPGGAAATDLLHTPVAETYSRVMRPSVGGRIPTLAKLGLLGGGMLLGDQVQKRLFGQ